MRARSSGEHTPTCFAGQAKGARGLCSFDRLAAVAAGPSAARGHDVLRAAAAQGEGAREHVAASKGEIELPRPEGLGTDRALPFCIGEGSVEGAGVPALAAVSG